MADRFIRAAAIDADNWRDPQHDLEAIQLANQEERSAIENFLIRRGIQHFIDAEALATLDTPTARQALIAAFKTGTSEIRAAVAYLTPHLIDDVSRTTDLIGRIHECDAYNGLTLTLSEIETNHPTTVIQAMLRRIACDPGVAAVHFAGLLLYLHGQASEPFDWDQRPFLLRFNPGDEADRQAAFADLCSKIQQNPAEFVVSWPSA